MALPLFIAIEGPDGSGKTTAIHALELYLKQKGAEVVLTREPGGTLLSNDIRQILLDTSRTMCPATELLLMYAARTEHIEQVIKPALAEGKVVLCDRFNGSSMAYQGYGHGLHHEVTTLDELFVNSQVKLDYTLYFSVDRDVALERVGTRGNPDRLELAAESFRTRVQGAYEHIYSSAGVASSPGRGEVVVIDANLSQDEVMAQVEAFAAARILPRHNGDDWLNEKLSIPDDYSPNPFVLTHIWPLPSKKESEGAEQ